MLKCFESLPPLRYWLVWLIGICKHVTVFFCESVSQKAARGTVLDQQPGSTTCGRAKLNAIGDDSKVRGGARHLWPVRWATMTACNDTVANYSFFILCLEWTDPKSLNWLKTMIDLFCLYVLVCIKIDTTGCPEEEQRQMSGGGKRKRRLLPPTVQGPSGWRFRQGERREGIGEARPRRALVKNTTGRWETENVTSVCLFLCQRSCLQYEVQHSSSKARVCLSHRNVPHLQFSGNLGPTCWPSCLVWALYRVGSRWNDLCVRGLPHSFQNWLRFENPNTSPPSRHPCSDWDKS